MSAAIVLFVKCPSCGTQCSVMDGKVRNHKGIDGVCVWSGRLATDAAKVNRMKSRREW